MATVPNPEPDYGPVDSPPQPSELPPMPGDVDVPEPGVEGTMRQMNG